jgi:hypothetical protein
LPLIIPIKHYGEYWRALELASRLWPAAWAVLEVRW